MRNGTKVGLFAVGAGVVTLIVLGRSGASAGAAAVSGFSSTESTFPQASIPAGNTVEVSFPITNTGSAAATPQ